MTIHEWCCFKVNLDPESTFKCKSDLKYFQIIIIILAKYLYFETKENIKKLLHCILCEFYKRKTDKYTIEKYATYFMVAMAMDMSQYNLQNLLLNINT